MINNREAAIKYCYCHFKDFLRLQAVHIFLPWRGACSWGRADYSKKNPIPFPFRQPHLEALKTKENMKYTYLYIYIHTYIYLCTYWGQSDLLVLDNKLYKEMSDLSVFI